MIDFQPEDRTQQRLVGGIATLILRSVGVAVVVAVEISTAFRLPTTARG